MNNDIVRQIADQTSAGVLFYVFIGMIIGFGLMLWAKKRGSK